MANDQEGHDSQAITLRPIGYVERDPEYSRLRGKELRARPARIVLDRAVTNGLLGLEPGDDIIVLCYFHRSDHDVLQVHPMGDLTRPLRGVFATRSPARPNPIAVTSARIQHIEENIVHVLGLDAFDRSPVLDIKISAPSCDCPLPTQDGSDA
jgi:L-fuculose-phosphate aldolase